MFFFSKASANQVNISIQGVEGELGDNVDAYLQSIAEQDYSTSLQFQAQLERSFRDALKALGYYNAKFHFSVKKSDLVISIDPGDPVIIEKSDLLIEGEAKQDKEFQQLIEESGLDKGAILNHGLYEKLKSDLRNLALKKGYFNGQFIVHKLDVAPSINQAFVSLHYESGIRYQFGDTQILGSQIDLDRVVSLTPYEKKEFYDVTKVGEFNQSLSNTDWFSSVLVEPDLSELGDERELPIKVSLAPQARNKIETGLGYGTDVGVRGSLKWKKPWVNSRGHSFDSNLSLSDPEQSLKAGYSIPLQDVLKDFYRIQLGIKRRHDADTNSIQSNLAFERHWILDNGWHTKAYTRYLTENYTQGLQDDNGQFLLLGMSFSRSRIRGNSMPLWADRQDITIEYGDPSLLSDTRVTRLLAGTAWIRSIGNNHRGIFRIDAGANFAEGFDKLPPSLRFFAGGDSNLRGYGYKSISPTDSSGALTGAKYIATSTLEYQYRIYQDWWGAAFYDVGDAFNDSFEVKRSTGFGVRWGSPLGAVRLDFAWGLDASEGSEFKLHFTLGPEL